ncbi:MAG: GMP/IMP nucleotidase [Gammaproteobacteria bacterium]|nr:GMP/IMP nucleotidase [Gammaproteobacteria bacterium]
MLVWDDIETVLLDMDGTLLDLYFDNYFWQEYLPLKWAELNGLDVDVAKHRLMPQFRRMTGTLSWYCLDYWSEQLKIDVFALKTEVEHLIGVRPQAEQFLAFLQQANKQVVLVTNSHQKLLALKMEKTGIDKYFDRIFSAHSLGAAKEELDFWYSLSDNFTFSADKTVLIDDNLTVLRTAREYGIRHLLCVAKPDSRVCAQDAEEFTALSSFASLCS